MAEPPGASNRGGEDCGGVGEDNCQGDFFPGLWWTGGLEREADKGAVGSGGKMSRWAERSKGVMYAHACY